MGSWFQRNIHLATIFIVSLLTNANSLSAQVDTLKSDYVGISYFSEGGFYPGFTFTFERSLLANKNFELMAAARLGSYFHYRNHTGVFLTFQSGQRIRLYKNLYFEHYVGIGYLHSFLNGGDAYYVDATGSIHKNNNLGSPHLMPSISFGLGYNTKISNRRARFLARPIIFWLIPFNRASLVQYGLEVGALVNLAK
ncbi:MAG: hypothetical protein ABI477_07425 [Chryseolinea sp.]